MKNYSFHLRKCFFSPHVVNIWNSLPDYVVDTDSLDKFKTRIDEFWQQQEALFNYKSELSETGNQSQI